MALTVSTEELRQVAEDLRNKKEEILNIYNTKIISILEESKEAISASGLNFDDFKSTFSQVFGRIDTKITSLSNALTNTIIPKYDELNSYVGNAFNNDFANQMGELLGKMSE